MQSRRERVRALKGKYRFVKTSSEEFIRRKQAEIDLEDRVRPRRSPQADKPGKDPLRPLEE